MGSNKSYLMANHPRILYIDLGDNDDFAHAGLYGDYRPVPVHLLS
jgi:hypothetical protein